jgi:hypothetical protein
MRISSRQKRALAVASTTTGLIAAAALLQAPAAQADSSVCNPDCSAAAEWQSYGEVLTVHDYASNGRSTVALLDLNRDGSTTPYWNTNGFAGPAAVYNLDFPEDIPIRYRVCENDSNALVNCGGWRNDVT